MNQKEFLEYHRQVIESMHDTCKKKNADYCGGKDNNDAFANFRLVEAFEVTTAEIGLFTRLLDKLSRIASFLKQGQLLVTNESVVDTLIDAANYCILMAAFLQSKNKE
jgi:hypothetical protein